MTRQINAEAIVMYAVRPEAVAQPGRPLDYHAWGDVTGFGPEQVTIEMYPKLSEAEQAMDPEPDYPVFEIHFTSAQARELAEALLAEADHGDATGVRKAARQGWIDRDVGPLLS
jgi:hypothetical protein